jgi:hypothetical protein
VVSVPRCNGLDVDEQGSVTARTFEITFLEPGVEAYVFTFG